MYEYGIITNLIDDIPNLNEYQKPQNNKKNYTIVVDLIPEKKCSWEDDVMDFRPYFKYHTGSRNILHFDKCYDSYKNYVKEFVLNDIDTGNKISTANQKVINLNIVLHEAISINKQHSFELLTTSEIEEALEEHTQRSLENRKKLYSVTWAFFDFLRINNYDITLVDSFKLYKDYRTICSHRIFIEHKHSTYLSDELMKEIMTTMHSVLINKNLPINDRMIAGMTLLNTQLGLRNSEIPALSKNCIDSMMCNDGIERNFIWYKSFKTTRIREYEDVKTLCTKLAKQTIEEILEVRKQFDQQEENEYLLMLDIPDHNPLKIISGQQFYRYYKKVYLTYLWETALQEWPGIKRSKAYVMPKKIKDTMISCPGIHSYRVTFATNLYKQGVHPDYINVFLGHSPASDVDDAYIVPKDIEVNKMGKEHPELNEYDEYFKDEDNDE